MRNDGFTKNNMVHRTQQLCHTAVLSWKSPSKFCLSGDGTSEDPSYITGRL